MYYHTPGLKDMYIEEDLKIVSEAMRIPLSHIVSAIAVLERANDTLEVLQECVEDGCNPIEHFDMVFDVWEKMDIALDILKRARMAIDAFPNDCEFRLKRFLGYKIIQEAVEDYRAKEAPDDP